MKKPRVKVVIRISKELLKRLDTICDASDEYLPRNTLIERILALASKQHSDMDEGLKE